MTLCLNTFLSNQRSSRNSANYLYSVIFHNITDLAHSSGKNPTTVDDRQLLVFKDTVMFLKYFNKNRNMGSKSILKTCSIFKIFFRSDMWLQLWFSSNFSIIRAAIHYISPFSSLRRDKLYEVFFNHLLFSSCNWRMCHPEEFLVSFGSKHIFLFKNTENNRMVVAASYKKEVAAIELNWCNQEETFIIRMAVDFY